jgi:pimeloyl-ACP methyl ester carboxylesterase
VTDLVPLDAPLPDHEWSDEVVAYGDEEGLVRELPTAEHAVISGAGHLPPVERPAETAALVRRFLSA